MFCISVELKGGAASQSSLSIAQAVVVGLLHCIAPAAAMSCRFCVCDDLTLKELAGVMGRKVEKKVSICVCDDLTLKELAGVMGRGKTKKTAATKGKGKSKGKQKAAKKPSEVKNKDKGKGKTATDKDKVKTPVKQGKQVKLRWWWLHPELPGGGRLSWKVMSQISGSGLSQAEICSIS